MISGLIQIIESCNYKCSHCSQNAPLISRNHLELSEDRFIRYLDIFKLLKVEKIQLTGGEVCLHSDLVNLVSFANDYGFDVNIVTNGRLLNSNLLENLRHSGLMSISISLYDFTEKEYETITGVKNSFVKILSNIKLAKELLGNVGIYAFLSDKNVHRLDNLSHICSSIQVSQVKLIQAMEQGRNSKNRYSEIAPLILDKVESFSRSLKGNRIAVKLSLNTNNTFELSNPEHRFCKMSLSHDISIDVRGNVYSCCLLMNKGKSHALFNIESVTEENYLRLQNKWDNKQILKKLTLSNQVNEKCCLALDNYPKGPKFVCPIKYVKL